MMKFLLMATTSLMLAMPITLGMLSGGTPAAIATYIKSVGFAPNATTFSDSTFDFGVESDDRRIMIGVTGRSTGGAAGVNTVTMGGIPGVQVIDFTFDGDNNGCAIFSALVPTGTINQTISVTMNSQHHQVSIAAWRTTGVPSNTPTDTLTSSLTPPTGSIDVPANGFIICCGFNSATSTCTWTNATERDDILVEGLNSTWADFSSPSAISGRTITTTYTVNDKPGLAVAAFGPAP